MLTNTRNNKSIFLLKNKKKIEAIIDNATIIIKNTTIIVKMS